MSIVERLAWWFLARAIGQYRNGRDGVFLSRYAVSKDLHRRLDGAMHLSWPSTSTDRT